MPRGAGSTRAGSDPGLAPRRRPLRSRRAAAVAAAAVVLAAAAVALEARSRPAAPGVVVMAAGDIACDPASADYQAGNGTPSDCQQRATARLVQRQRPDAVLALGDLQYENGALDKFLVSYADSWGRLKDVTHPAIGNHEYLSGYPGYFAYFGAAAGPSRRGYYSFELGAWHVVSLNSNCAEAGGCGVRSPQVAWLRRDLRAHPARCTLAFWHHPHFSSGQHGNDDGGHDPTGAFWSALAAAGADVVLNGHDHDYERFAPQSPTGEPDPRRGIREFVVGTGGRSHYRFHHLQRNSVVRDDRAFGALRLDLRPGSYSWRFVALPGVLLSDAGDGRCH